MALAGVAVAHEDDVAWTNWVGNQRFHARRVYRPGSEEDVRGAFAEILRGPRRARVAGAGHSFTPLVETAGAVLDLSRLDGVVACDRRRRTARIRGGTLIRDLGEPLWASGLALPNQGDIDTQTIAGAIATGTHGSGTTSGSLSSTLIGGRLVTPRGEVIDLAADPALLRAAKVSLGMLGALSEVTLQLVEAYHLDEEVVIMAPEEVLDRWSDLLARHRHFSFFFLPTERSASLYGLHRAGNAAGQCFVKLYQTAEGSALTDSGHRVDRSYRIYPNEFAPNFHEMEYMMALSDGPAVFEEVRDLVCHRHPECDYPVEVRFVGADDGLLSPFAGRESVVISVSGEPGRDYWPFLRDVDAIFARYDGRPHWGKLHFLDRARTEALYPELDAFRAIRAELDPDGVLLNDHVAELVA